MASIEITISPEGRVISKVNGVKGRDCTKVDDFIEKELGKVVSAGKTDEYYKEKKKVVLIRPSG